MPEGAVTDNVFPSLDIVPEWPPTAGPFVAVDNVIFVQAGLETVQPIVTSKAKSSLG